MHTRLDFQKRMLHLWISTQDAQSLIFQGCWVNITPTDSSQIFSCSPLLQIKICIAKGTRGSFLNSFYFQYFLTVEIGLSDTWWHSVTDDTAHKAKKGAKLRCWKFTSVCEKERRGRVWEWELGSLKRRQMVWIYWHEYYKLQVSPDAVKSNIRNWSQRICPKVSRKTTAFASATGNLLKPSQTSVF